MRLADFIGLGGLYPALWIVEGAGMAAYPEWACFWGLAAIVTGVLAMVQNARQEQRQRENSETAKQQTALLERIVRATTPPSIVVAVGAASGRVSAHVGKVIVGGPYEVPLGSRLNKTAEDILGWVHGHERLFPAEMGMYRADSWEQYLASIEVATREYEGRFAAVVRGLVDELEKTGVAVTEVAALNDAPGNLMGIRSVGERLRSYASEVS